MGWLEQCDYCWESTRRACSRHDSKRDCATEVMSCPLASKHAKLLAMDTLGFDVDWTSAIDNDDPH